MKVALCIQGQPRNWKLGYYQLKAKIIDPFNNALLDTIKTKELQNKIIR